ncbi:MULTISPECIES: hypothetical protein [Microcystis]|uniref:hypothetical protein n=1 Tax=Microcystis TaxID=1125 RepID=UPI000689482D|nr:MULTISPECIES: hypothetical protein [Microcystis]TRT70885.1 MAG: hypothetical protein EWV83_22675 [Microcystis sp. M_OC_Ca_00000000_S217Cul]TRT84622.1 MAG: hypothetical protein EWV66_20015 [Microcystis sp. M_OC_Ca_00000000_C217Col]
MSTHNLDDKKLSLDREGKTPQKLTYRQPSIYSLGSLEQIQADNYGNRFDGPDRVFFYNARANG